MGQPIFKGNKMKKQIIKKVIAWASLVTLVLYSVIAVVPRGDNYKGNNILIRKDGELPMLIAHGGGNEEFPDNTLEAFYNAYSVDKNVMMETDVNLTKDGVLILSHDTRLDRKTNVTGLIEDWNYSDLIAQRVNFGYDNDTEKTVLVGERSIYTNGDGVAVTPLDVTYPEGVTPRDDEIYYATKFEELLTAFPENIISVEIKQKGKIGIEALDELVRILKKHDAFDRVIIATFHGNVYRTVKKYQRNGTVPENVMYSPSLFSAARYTLEYYSGLDIFYRDGLAVFQFPTEAVGVVYTKPSFIKNMHERNVAVQFWTIDDEDEMRSLIELGADGIMTNYPTKLKAVLDEYREK